MRKAFIAFFALIVLFAVVIPPPTLLMGASTDDAVSAITGQDSQDVLGNFAWFWKIQGVLILIVPLLYIADKIVKLTPNKYDDVISILYRFISWLLVPPKKGK